MHETRYINQRLYLFLASCSNKLQPGYDSVSVSVCVYVYFSVCVCAVWLPGLHHTLKSTARGWCAGQNCPVRYGLLRASVDVACAVIVCYLYAPLKS